jgi:maltose alpha-D-glucosyltransferase/alpha-amylase
MGIDGFRVDAVPYLIEREGTNSENLPETHDILKMMRNFVDERYPGRILLGEANQWPQDLLPYFGDENSPEFHMCFHFPVMPRLYMAIALEDRASVMDILAQTPPIPESTQWATFLRNHDELTLEMVTEEERQFMWEFYAPDPRQRLNLGIRRRLAPLVENDRRRIELLHSLLFSLPGAPVLYYGDEIGMGDNILLEDRNGVRTPMQWNDSENGGFSNARLENLYAPSINDPDYGYPYVNVLAQELQQESILHTIRNMIYMRKQLPVLARAELVWLDELPPQALCFWRKDENGKMLALHNLSDDELTIPLPNDSFTSPLGLGTLTRNGSSQPVITLPPYGYHWLVLTE